MSLVRERYQRKRSPLEDALLRLPGMESLQVLLDQSGSTTPPHHVVLGCFASAAAAGFAGLLLLGWGPGPVVLAMLGTMAPIMWLQNKRKRRLGLFEEQLPDALTVMARALRAGMPFTEALNVVAQELKEPASKEFGIVFTEINYGGDARSALLGLLERVPSVAVMALVTTVLIQRETGGNLAEVLDKLAAVVRERFRFQRSVRTLSAEGRLAGWILSLLPFGMAAVLSILNPDFIPMLTKDPTGRELILWAFGLIVIGILWLKKIVKIDV
jgi:tight adherence protein B